jgi:formate dehydrogenase subunit gamma
MVATMPPSPEQVRRFTPGERWTHLALGALMGVLIITAALLYIDALSTLVGRRDLVATIHFVSGLLLPIPLLLAIARSAAFRADARRLNRWQPADYRWLRRAARGDLSSPSGKFNAGQKLNSAFVLAAVVIMFATGLMLHYFDLLPDNIRTGATFVHDLFATAVVIMAAGHVWMAYGDPEARRGLKTGYVSRDWAEHEHALWAAEMSQPVDRSPES